MLNTTTLRIEDNVLKNISKMANKLHLDRGTFLRQLIMKAYEEELLETNIGEYKKGKISISELAEKTDRSIWEIIETLKQKRIESNLTLKDIENSSKL
ncbi:ribbon-helix-helix protein, CopG family [Candidatus Woesearchaeota archaeon]|nr:ribbon-helix-helix protein, CopG family [Candidatus Woesearchaeota archaeon]